MSNTTDVLQSPELRHKLGDQNYAVANTTLVSYFKKVSNWLILILQPVILVTVFLLLAFSRNIIYLILSLVPILLFPLIRYFKDRYHKKKLAKFGRELSMSDAHNPLFIQGSDGNEYLEIAEEGLIFYNFKTNKKNVVPYSSIYFFLQAKNLSDNILINVLATTQSIKHFVINDDTSELTSVGNNNGKQVMEESMDFKSGLARDFRTRLEQKLGSNAVLQTTISKNMASKLAYTKALIVIVLELVGLTLLLIFYLSIT